MHLTDTYLLFGVERRIIVWCEVGIRVATAADGEKEIVTIVQELPVIAVAGVHRSLETQLQQPILIRHPRIRHVLCYVFVRLTVTLPSKPVHEFNGLLYTAVVGTLLLTPRLKPGFH